MHWQRIRAHLDLMYDLALRETGRSHDAEDVVQEVAASALSAPDPREPRAYLAGAVLRRARHVRRGEGRRRRREAHQTRPAPATQPGRAALVRDEVEGALAMLDDRDRQAVVLHHLHDLGYDEIGMALHISPEAARQRVHRAMLRVRQRYGRNGATAIALLPIATAPSWLDKPPSLVGVLLMKASTKTAIAVLAITAGAVTAASTSEAPTPMRSAHIVASPKERPPVKSIDEVVATLKVELETYPELDARNLVVFANKSLRGKLAAIDALPQSDRNLIAMRLGEQVHKTGEGLEEALDLLRDESDPRVLYWLAPLLRTITLNGDRIPDATREAFAPVAMNGEPAERRRAAVALSIGKPYQKASPAWVRALEHVYATERDSRVIRMAADTITFSWIDRPAERLLEAYRRMDPGEDRRTVAIRYRVYVSFAEVTKRYDESRDVEEQTDWATAIGYKLGEGKVAEERAVLTRVYRETESARMRAWLALRRLDNRPVTWLGPLIELEPDAELRALLEGGVAGTVESFSQKLREFRR